MTDPSLPGHKIALELSDWTPAGLEAKSYTDSIAIFVGKLSYPWALEEEMGVLVVPEGISCSEPSGSDESSQALVGNPPRIDLFFRGRMKPDPRVGEPIAAYGSWIYNAKSDVRLSFIYRIMAIKDNGRVAHLRIWAKNDPYIPTNNPMRRVYAPASRPRCFCVVEIDNDSSVCISLEERNTRWKETQAPF